MSTAKRRMLLVVGGETPTFSHRNDRLRVRVCGSVAGVVRCRLLFIPDGVVLWVLRWIPAMVGVFVGGSQTWTRC